METFLSNLVGVCVAGAVFVTLSGFPSTSYAAPVNEVMSKLDSAVHVLYESNDTVQRAIDIEQCTDTGRDWAQDGIKVTMRNLNDKIEHDMVERALQAAYDATSGRDNELEYVNAAFCFAVGER